MKGLKQCRVLVTPTSYASQDLSLKTDLEDAVGEVIYNTTGKPLSSSQLMELVPGVDGWIAGLDEINNQVISAAADLKVIARYGVGYNNIDLEAAKARGIIVTNTPGANSKAVAELTIALTLHLLRPINQCAQQTAAGEWPRQKGYSLEGKVVGLIGLGAIGKEVARRLVGFDCQVVGYDLSKDEDFCEEHHVKIVPLADLLDQADIVSLHVPGTPETRNMVDRGFLNSMKDGSWLVNTSRGDLIDEGALIDAIESGKLRGAALDVFQQEPLDKKSPLLSLKNIILTPHMGAHADSATNTMGRMALDDCLRVLSGEEPKHVVI